MGDELCGGDWGEVGKGNQGNKEQENREIWERKEAVCDAGCLHHNLVGDFKMIELSWKDAIIKTLSDAKEPLHYQEIAERILSADLKKSTGATPANTVNAQIAASIKHEGALSPYLRVAKGTFTLRSKISQSQQAAAIEEEVSSELVKAFGMYWKKDFVIWKAIPALYGWQQVGAKTVDFGGQRGVYVLYDHHAILYVGRTTNQSLGQRLFDHTRDRLSERWDRFSWFGLYGVSEGGKLIDSEIKLSIEILIETLEALLIEALEPPLNRKRGDSVAAVEYLQAQDPQLKKIEFKKTFESIQAKFMEE